MAAPFSYFLCGMFCLLALIHWKRTHHQQLLIYKLQIPFLKPFTTANLAINTVRVGEEEFSRHSLSIGRLPLKLALATAGRKANVDTPAFLPATAIGWTKDSFTRSDYFEIAADFAARDDVWNVGFLLGGIISPWVTAIFSCEYRLSRASGCTVIILRVGSIRKVKNETSGNVIVVVTDFTSTQLPDGPYMVQSLTGKTFPVSKLFKDTYHAFIGGAVMPNEKSNSFHWTQGEVSSQTHFSLQHHLPVQ